MLNGKLFQIIFGVILATGAPIAEARTYHVLKTGFIGEFSTQADAFRALVISTIKESGDHKLTTNIEKADVVLQPKLIETGDNYLLFLDIIKNEEVVSSRVIKIKGFDELDYAVERLIDATLNEKPVRQTIEVGKVTRAEQSATINRMETHNSFYLGFGPAISSGMRSKEPLVSFDIGFAREFEQDVVKAMISTQSGMNGDRSGFAGLGLGFQHIFTKKDIAPFLGAQLLYGGVSGNYEPEKPDSEPNYGHKKTGFMIGASAGYMLFRTASTHFDVGLQVRSFLGQIDSGLPATYALTVGLYL